VIVKEKVYGCFKFIWKRKRDQKGSWLIECKNKMCVRFQFHLEEGRRVT
jgi:hypothetical protein